MSYLISRTALLTVFALILTNVVHFQIPSFGLILLVLFSTLMSLRLGYAVTQSKSTVIQFTIGAWTLLSIASILGSIVYYVGQVTAESMLLVTGCMTLLGVFLKNPTFEQSRQSFEVRFVAGLGVVVVLLYSVFSVLSNTRITESVQATWGELNPLILLPIGLAAFITSALLIRRQRKLLQLIAVSALLLSGTLIGAVVYPLGLGFDPFIHQSTVAHIAEFGSITPKPFYYIGQYALELISHLVFLQDIAWTDKLLVPVLAGLLLPATTYIGLTGITKRYAIFGMSSLFLGPLATFTITTPQSLGYLFFFAQLFLTIPNLLYKEQATIHWSTLVLLTLATLVVHPIAGIASALLLTIALISLIRSKTLRRSFAGAWAVLGTTLFPLSFFAQSLISKLPLSLQIPELGAIQSSLSQFSPILDLLYLPIHGSLWVVLLLAAIGFLLIVRTKSHKPLLLTAAIALVLFGNFALMQFISFDFLIDYERQNYTNRLLVLGLIACLPLAGLTLMKTLQRLQSLPRPFTAAFLAALSLTFTANVYSAYPRHDVHSFSRDYNLSVQDIEAVKVIEQDAEDEPYVVLANQMVSAAALRTYGFAHYYRDNTAFYYPVPTSDTLYQFYLDMVDDSPRRDVAVAAMDYMGVDRLYLVINSYWWDAPRIIEQAKSTADEWIAVEDDLVIFLFTRPTN